MFKIRREDTTKGVSKVATPSDFNTNLTFRDPRPSGDGYNAGGSP